MEEILFPAGVARPFEVLVKVEPADSDDEGAAGVPPPPPAALAPHHLLPGPLELDARDAVPHPAGDLLRCLHCHRDLPPPDLQPHMVGEHAYRRVLFKCQVCSKTFEQRAELLAHRERKHVAPVELVTCEYCCLQFGKKYLHKHVQNVHCAPDVLHTCSLCAKLFKSKETLKDHVKTVHRSSEPVSCEFCNQEFKSKKYLVNHVRNVHPKGDKVFACADCAKVFKSRMCLHQHTKNVHPPESASAQCEACPKVFKTKANLSQHIKHCHPEKEARRAAAAAAAAGAAAGEGEAAAAAAGAARASEAPSPADGLHRPYEAPHHPAPYGSNGDAHPYAFSHAGYLRHEALAHGVPPGSLLDEALAEPLVHPAFGSHNVCSVGLMDAGLP